MNKLNLNLSIDLSNTQHAMFYGLLMKEVGKYGIDVTFGNITATATASTAQKQTTSTAKAVAPKPTKPTTTAKAVEPNGKYTVKNDAEFILVVDKDGYITITEPTNKVGRTAWRIASGILRNQGCTTVDKKDFRYYVVGKGGKMSKTATKKVFDALNGKITVTAKECNEVIAQRMSERD